MSSKVSIGWMRTNLESLFRRGYSTRAKEECCTCRGSTRPTPYRKVSFLSSSKAALPGGLRLFARLRGKDSNVDYLIQSRDSKPPLRTA